MLRSASKSVPVAFRFLKFRLFKFWLLKFFPTPLGFASALDISRQTASAGRAQQRAAPVRASFVRTQKKRGRAVKFLNFNVALFFIMRAKFYAPEFCAPEFFVLEFSLLKFSAPRSSLPELCEAEFCSLAVSALEFCEALWLKSQSEILSCEPRLCFIVL